MWVLALFAAAALAVDLVVHVATILGFNPQNWIQPDWLAAVSFWLLLLLTMGIASAVTSYRKRRARRQGLVYTEPRNPRWFKVIMWIVIVYAFANLIVFGAPAVRRGEPVELGAGQYALDPGHGHPVQPITEEQYHTFRRHAVRAFSGFTLMFFLQIAFDLLCLALGRHYPANPDPPKPTRWTFILWRWSRD
jgi:hypothetical protein